MANIGKNRTPQQVADSMLTFFNERWNPGVSFCLDDIRKHSKVVNPAAEIKIIKFFVNGQLLIKEKRPIPGKKGVRSVWRVKTNNPDILIDGLDRYVKSCYKREKPTREEKKLYNNLLPQESKQGMELLQQRVVDLVKENQGLKYDLGEYQQQCDKLKEQIEDLTHKHTHTNGLIKVCPNCHFDLHKYTTKYGSQIKNILEDCK